MLRDSSPCPDIVMPEPLADRAAVAVAGDEVAGAHRSFVAVVDVARDRRYAVVVLLDVDHLVRVHEAGAELAGPFEQDRLEHLLRQHHPPRRAELLDAGVDVGDEVGDLSPVQRLDVVHPAVGVVQRQRRRPHPVLDPCDPHQLVRAQLEVARPWMDRRAVVLLDRQHLDPVLGEEHRRRQPDHAAADDHDRHLHIHAARRGRAFVMTASVRQGDPHECHGAAGRRLPRSGRR